MFNSHRSHLKTQRSDVVSWVVQCIRTQLRQVIYAIEQWIRGITASVFRCDAIGTCNVLVLADKIMSWICAHKRDPCCNACAFPSGSKGSMFDLCRVHYKIRKSIVLSRFLGRIPMPLCHETHDIIEQWIIWISSCFFEWDGFGACNVLLYTDDVMTVACPIHVGVISRSLGILLWNEFSAFLAKKSSRQRHAIEEWNGGIGPSYFPMWWFWSVQWFGFYGWVMTSKHFQ